MAPALLARLPSVARDVFARRAAVGDPPVQSVDDLFARVDDWLTSAVSDEAHGGFPGGRGALDWTDYVELQRRHIAILHALVLEFGPPPLALRGSLDAYERRFPPPVRYMGDGYEPHVDDVAGRLIYSLPVDSGFVGTLFAFPIAARDLDVLQRDPYRRAVLEVVAHTVLQRSMIRGSAEVTEGKFASLVDRILHASSRALRNEIARVERTHNICIDVSVSEVMARRGAARSADDADARVG